jgi:cytochrome c oxidase subunit I
MGALAHEAHGHHGAHDHHDHHEEGFVSKYIFSQDHKMIGKQYLITAVFMGLLPCYCPYCLEFNWHGQVKVLIS